MPIQADILPLQIHAKHIVGYTSPESVYHVPDGRMMVAQRQEKGRIERVAIGLPSVLTERIELPRTWAIVEITVWMTLERGFTQEEQPLPIVHILGMPWIETENGEMQEMLISPTLTSGGLLPGMIVVQQRIIPYIKESMKSWKGLRLAIESDTNAMLNEVEYEITFF